jgi:hypothetical protein
MAARDSIKPKKYFDEQERYNAKTLDEFRAIIAAPATEPVHREQLRYAVFRRELEQLIVRYSRGEPIATLHAAFPRAIRSLEEYQQQGGTAAHDFGYFNAYVYALWIVSLAILLDVDDAELRRAVKDLGNEGRDALFDRLVALRIPESVPAATLMYPNPYEPLFHALDATGDERTRLIERFLAGYYDGMRDAYWHDTHLTDDSGYFGYWCFELAAFVKALGIPDDSFADNVLYPRDLVRRSGVT